RTKIPNMRDGNHQIDVSHPVSAYFLFGHFHATSVADNALITNAFVFSTSTFVIFYRPKNPLAEQTVAFRFMGTVVDGFRLEHLTTRFSQNRFRRSQPDRDFIKPLLCFTLVISSHPSDVKC